MQTKLTPRMDSEVIEAAKKVADERNVSLSQLVAGFFNALITSESSTGLPQLLPPKKTQN